MADTEDDSYVVIGRAFEVLREDEPRKKPVPVHEQVVTDEKGRRRFHGAFTGGFSAGYFNTVGSKEGWTPSSYVSSRSNRVVSKQLSNNPENFMDTEDFEDFGIAPKQVTVKDKFTGPEEQFAGLRKRIASENDLLSDDLLQDLIVFASVPIGEKLMQKMGWKKNQGVGPRRSYKKAALKERNAEVGEIADDPYAKGLLFAPQDVDNVSYKIKNDQKGLGYKGINPTDILRVSDKFMLPTPYKTSEKKHGISGQAFGVGAFEEKDDEIYGVDNMANYDNTMDEEVDKPDTYQLALMKNMQAKGRNQGLTVIEGFTFAGRPSSPLKTFPSPKIPQGFKPIHNVDRDVQIKDTSKGRHSMAAIQRGRLLGEKPIEGPSQSIGGLLTAADKDRLMEINKASGMNNVIEQSAQVSQASIQQEQKDERGITEWEKEQEKEDFAKTAKRFELLGKAMASRFTTSANVYTCGKEELANVVEQSEKDLDLRDRAKAASMKLFGKLTRRSFEWHPDKLLCKRFNIADPFPRSSIIGVPGGSSDKLSMKDNSSFLQAVSFTQSLTKSGDNITSPESRLNDDNGLPSRDIEENKLIDNSRTESIEAKAVSPVLAAYKETRTSRADDNNVEKSSDKDNDVEKERPSMDIFEAIFAEPSNDEESSESEASDIEEEQVSPLNDSSKVMAQKPSADLVSVTEMAEVKKEVKELGSYYGPALPPTYDINVASEPHHQLSEKFVKHRRSKEHKHKKKHKEKHRKVENQ